MLPLSDRIISSEKKSFLQTKRALVVDLRCLLSALSAGVGASTVSSYLLLVISWSAGRSAECPPPGIGSITHPSFITLHPKLRNTGIRRCSWHLKGSRCLLQVFVMHEQPAGLAEVKRLLEQAMAAASQAAPAAAAAATLPQSQPAAPAVGQSTPSLAPGSTSTALPAAMASQLAAMLRSGTDALAGPCPVHCDFL